MKSDGFTLLELLVAITIFSLIIGMAMFSLRYSFAVVRQIDAPFAEETQRMSKMRDSISSMFNYVTPSRDMFNKKKDYATYFSGEPGNMTYISNSPPSGRAPAVCRISLINGDVVLEEAPLYGDKTNYLSPSLDNTDKKNHVIASGINSLRFEYLNNGKKESSLKATLPSMVRIIISTDSGEREYFNRVLTNYDDKARMMRGADGPPI
jgi:prepilin-type N-terminal cleavage/methylation domain-containing protein